MRQPRGKPLPELDGRQLLRIKKDMFGLPDAPRLWFQAFSVYLVNDAGFEQTSLDCAFFKRGAETGNPTAMLISHVDDILLAHDGSPGSKKMEAALRERFPFGSWKLLKDAEVDYTGKSLTMFDEDGKRCIKVHQKQFADGRLDLMDVPARGGDPEKLLEPRDHGEYRSLVGSLSWLAGLTRLDAAFELNMLQKKQSAPTITDARRANRLAKELKETSGAGVVLRQFEPVGSMDLAVVAWTDSALFNSLD